MKEKANKNMAKQYYKKALESLEKFVEETKAGKIRVITKPMNDENIKLIDSILGYKDMLWQEYLLQKSTADEAKKAYLEHIDKGLAEIKKKIAGGELLSSDYEYAYYVYNNTLESISKAASYSAKEGR